MTGDTYPEHPFTWAQIREAGISRARFRAAVREHRVKRLIHGVYLRGDIEATFELRLMAVALVVSTHMVVRDRTAAWIWGVGCHDLRELDVVPPIELSALRGRAPSDRAGVRGGTRDLIRSDWVEVYGVKVSTPLRTAMDLGCHLNRRAAIAAMDALMRVAGFSCADMLRMQPRFFGRRGVVQLRELVPLVDGRAESPGESWTRLVIIDAGLPVPELQWWVYVDGVPTYRLDLAYPLAKIAVEYDGEEFHSSAEDKTADQRRRRWLIDHGWTVIVLDKRSFSAEAVVTWTSELGEALREAQRPTKRYYAPSGR